MNKTAQTTKNLAKQIAKQMAQEPLEILKDVKEQVVGSEGESQRKEAPNQETEIQNTQQNAEIDKLRAARRMEALTRELSDIRKQDIFKLLQEKIAQGIEVPIEDYQELTLEQKQVLKAQMEAMKAQRANMSSQDQGLQEPQAKKGRKMGNFFGKKTSMKREQTRVEKVVPPSG